MICPLDNQMRAWLRPDGPGAGLLATADFAGDPGLFLAVRRLFRNFPFLTHPSTYHQRI